MKPSHVLYVLAAAFTFAAAAFMPTTWEGFVAFLLAGCGGVLVSQAQRARALEANRAASPPLEER